MKLKVGWFSITQCENVQLLDNPYLTRTFSQIMHNLACLLIPHENFPQSGVIIDTHLLLLFPVKPLVYTIYCAIFVQIYEISGLRKTPVIPAKAGIQTSLYWPCFLDSGLRRNDENRVISGSTAFG